jgi:putative tryptophan/tyrosine transport system substrate-binding protein
LVVWHSMKRREFIALLGTSALPWTLAAKAQSRRKIARIGVLWHAGSAEEEREYLAVLVKAFSDLGYIEGKNVELLHKFPAEQIDRFHVLARELVESNVDVVIAVTEQGAVALKQITETIPVVFAIVADPVGLGLVASLARPGGNMTGLSIMAVDTYGKRLTLLKEAIPNVSSVDLFIDATAKVQPSTLAAFANAATALGLSSRSVEIPAPDAIEPAFARAQSDHVDGVLVTGPMLFNERARVGASALTHQMPAIGIIAEMVPYGLLMSYGQDFPDFFRRAAGYADKVLRGAKPADLPVEQPTRFKQVINLKAAKALGLTIPPSLLVTADEVIE